MVKKGVKVWVLIVVLVIVGSGVTMTSVGSGLIPACPELRELHHEMNEIGYNHTQIHSTATLYNPNIFPLKFKRVEYSIFLNDIVIGSGHSEENIAILPRSEKELTFESEIYLSQIPELFKERIKTREETNVNIRGDITFDLGIFNYKHPLNISVTELWKKRFNNSFSFAYPVTDLTGDKTSEMVIDIWHFEDDYISGEVHVVDGVDGSVLWNRSLGRGIPVAYPATDLNGDNVTDFIVNVWDIFIGNLSTKILILDGFDGSKLWEWEDEEGLAAAYPCTDFTGDKISEIVIDSYSFVSQVTSLSGSSSMAARVPENFSSSKAVAKTKGDSPSVTPDMLFSTKRESTPHHRKTYHSEKVYAMGIVPHAQFSLDENFGVGTEGDTIKNGIQECWRGFWLDIYNYDDVSDMVLGNLSFSAQAANITDADWNEYAKWNESCVEWKFPSYPSFTINEDGGFGTGFRTFSEERYMDVDVTRWMNETVFDADGYQLVNFNVTFKDTNFLWCWGRIEANEYNELRAAIVPGSFDTDAPGGWNEWDHGVHFDFDREQIETNVTYHFSVIVRVEPKTPSIVYKPRFELGQGLYESQSVGEGYCAKMPVSMLPEGVYDTSACSNVSNQWTIKRQDYRFATLQEVVELTGPHAEFHLNKESNVWTKNDAISSGTYGSAVSYYLHIQNTEDDSDMVLGDLKFAANADNITGVDWSEYAGWNETAVEWAFPAEFVITEDEGFGTGFGTNHIETQYLNFDLTRWMNQTEFNESGYQLVRFNMTFHDKNFEWIWGDISANEHYEVNSSIVPNTFETDAPLTWNVWEHGVHFDFDKEQIETNVTYHFSVIVKVEPTGKEALPILYKPQFSIGEGLYYNSTTGAGYKIEIPAEMLPDNVSYAAASTNVSNAWLIKRHNQIIVGLEEVVEVPPEIPATEVYLFDGSTGEELWNKSLRNCLAAAYPISDIDDDNVSELLINKWVWEDDEVSFSRIEIVKGIDCSEMWNMSFAGWLVAAYPVSDLNGDNDTELVVNAWREPVTEIFVYDGQDGSLLWNRSVNEGYLAAAYPVTDFTGDKITEIAINAINFENPSTIIEVVDGADGSLLWSKTINNSLSAIYPATDLTKDGTTELMITSWFFSNNTLSGSEILIVNGVSGSILWNLSTEDGIAVAYPATDLTHNNVSEIIINVWGQKLESTEIFIFEGLTHTELFSKTMNNSLAAAYPISDLTGDNVSEVAINELNFEGEKLTHTNITILSIKPSVVIFDTGEGTYPSISGIHNGTITPNANITVSKLYTYFSLGTGGHTQYAAISYSNGMRIAEAHWNGYIEDWHNISFNTTFVLYANETYNYTIRTGSYPHIIHEKEFNATGGKITCSEFVDVNGNRHEDWIPAIKLWSD